MINSLFLSWGHCAGLQKSEQRNVRILWARWSLNGFPIYGFVKSVKEKVVAECK